MRQRSFSVETSLHCSKMDGPASTYRDTIKPSMNASRYKTELCRPFQEYGSCKYGDKCQFAHGTHDLRALPRHPKYKTELCRTFYSTGYCPYGTRCHFIHTKGESRATQVTRTISPFTTFPQTIRPPLSPSQDSGISSPDEHSASFGTGGSNAKVFEFPLSDASYESDTEDNGGLVYSAYDGWSVKSPIDPTLYLNDMDSQSNCSLSPIKTVETDLSNRLSSISLDDGLFSNPSRSRLPVFDMLNSQSDTALVKGLVDKTCY